MKCIHYYICSNSYILLCDDSKCVLNKNQLEKENIFRKDSVRRMLDEYKATLGIESFLELNKNM